MTRIPGTLAVPDLNTLGPAFVAVILLVALAIVAYSFLGSHR